MTTIPARTRPQTGAWYCVITAASVGALACVPFFHVASVLKRRALWRLGAVYAGAALLNVAPEDAAGTPTGPVSDVGAVIMIGSWLAPSSSSAPSGARCTPGSWHRRILPSRGWSRPDANAKQQETGPGGIPRWPVTSGSAGPTCPGSSTMATSLTSTTQLLRR